MYRRIYSDAVTVNNSSANVCRNFLIGKYANF